MKFKSIGIMCGSSEACSEDFKIMAFKLGEYLAMKKINLIYGGGAKGLMNQAANGALSKGGNVFGYMPEFMTKVEWQHKGLTKLVKTKDMAQRKFLMMSESDGTVFLPGGSGTMEELFEWMCNKRLGRYTGPLIIFDMDNYYAPLRQLLDNMIEQKFHADIHGKMYHFCESIEELEIILETYEPWSKDAINFAAVK